MSTPARPARPADLQVRPIRYTDHHERWLPTLEALGAATLLEDGPWHLYALGSGLLAIHEVPSAHPAVGTTELGLTVPDLLTLDPVVADRDDVERVDTQAGPAVRLRAADGMVVDVMAADPASGSHRRPSDRETPWAVTVRPLWMTPDVPAATAGLTVLGLVDRVRSDSGVWADLAASGGGLIGVHQDRSTAVVLSFESADVAAIAVRFGDRGLRADIVDESYGRSLRIDDPDGGVELWVNETMTDFYGYRRFDG